MSNSLLPSPAIRFLAILWLALISTIVQPRAARAFDLGFVGGLNSAYQGVAERNWGANSSAKATFAFGTLLNFSLLPLFSLETGVIYSTHKTGTSLGFDETKNLVIPIVGRLWLLPILSIGAGPYYSLGLGNYRTVSTPETAATTQANPEYSAVGYSKGDYGFLLSANLSFPIAPGLNVLGDIRHYVGLKDRNVRDIGAAEHVHFTQMLAGIQFTY
jgi:hypothetical protein